MDDPVSQFKHWYFRQPKFTRTYLSAAMILTVLVSLKLLGIQYVYYDFNFTFFHFNLWRPFTALVFQGKFGFNFLFGMLFSYFALSRVENDLFQKNTYADFLWLCLFVFTGITLCASIVSIPFTGDGFIFAFIYIWCKRRPFETITFFFGLKCKSGYFPWVLMGFRLLMGASVWGELAGLFLGHMYITIKDLFVPKYHKDYLSTPKFFQRWIYGAESQVNSGQQRARPPPQGGFQGRGVQIG